ncbi:DUF421 domain-containing protein [Neobacillus piezotolerans]|uniref:DUF421 domain-containing protein n=1 Tax=Neobacillus piezotolerans TaxID=2259171 RepID=A0A3D8GVV1_9BACI|nr:YetF domain-containing protein [Neobacillus piezotolerans]RDU38291.1 DUF421 domain-containing protein [Neobacillus piezotolerans]
MEEFLVPIGRTLTSFVLLVFVTLVIGKHINSHKNHYSFALSVSIGSFIANMGFHTNLKFMDILIAFIALLILYYLCLLLSWRSRWIREWLSGRPTVLIENGKILDMNMKKLKMSIDDLNQLLREKDIFNIGEVEYALLEVSGTLSIIKKSPFQPPVKRDFGIMHSHQSLPIELIMDGKIIAKNTNGIYSSDWIKGECKKRNLKVEDIYYAVINTSGVLFIDKYEDSLSSPVDVE